MKGTFLIALLAILSCPLFSQTIQYQFSAPNAAHHEAAITVTADKLPVGPAIFRMSRSSPGRYAKHEFGKNVYDVKAYDENGKALKVEKTDADIYKVSGHKGIVKLTYTLFANYADGTYASVDRTGYHLNMPASFMWVKGLEKAPVTLSIMVPDSNWKIATQLKPTSNPTTFTAPDLQYFFDSPTKVGNLQISDWMVTNPDNKKYVMELAVETKAQPEILKEFTPKVARMVEEAKAVFGEVPAYDYGKYTFIASINPYVKGDGMEHRNSTMIALPTVFDGGNYLLGVFSHEFFHCWNVERIRPADLEPFDFEKSNMSEGLWVAEGFTQYYGDLILTRAGLQNENDFLRKMTGLINIKNNTPGGQDYSPVENSQRAVFVDAGVAIDKTNYQNMFASYYTYGAAIALALDLDLRSHFKNTTLDNFMQELWKRFGKTGKPYTVKDLQPALAAITNAEYASNFFTKYVFGHEPFNYQEVFINAGLNLVPAAPQKAWAGKFGFANNANELIVDGATIKNTPLYNAGVDDGDQLLYLDNKKLKGKNDFKEIVDAHKPGDKLPVTFMHKGDTIIAELVLGEDTRMTIADETNKPTNQQQQFKMHWLGSKVKKP